MCLSRHPLADDPHRQSLGADHEGGPTLNKDGRSVPEWSVVPQSGRPYRGLAKTLHAYATALPVAGRPNRRCRLIKGTKDTEALPECRLISTLIVPHLEEEP